MLRLSYPDETAGLEQDHFENKPCWFWVEADLGRHGNVTDDPT
jgi:hypothetical protein